METVQMSRLTRGMVALALGAGFASAAFAGISTTKHNLGTTAVAGNNQTGGTGEICVFCHTPHAADVSVAGVPLWNKRLATGGAAFTVYASSTMDAGRATDGQVGSLSIGSVSIACLSCHDGAQAMDNMLNSPGSGGWDSAGGGAGGNTAAAYNWTGSSVTTGGLMINSGTTLAMLGKDLSNDHPIGIQYCGGGPTQASPATACTDVDFRSPSNAVIGGQTVLWVENLTATAGRQKNDMILYNRTFTGGIVGPSVECASCHDPHTGTNPTFLRVSNASSAVCLTCHVK